MPPPYCDEHDGYIARYLETGEARIIGRGSELVGRRKDGSSFPLDLTVSEVDHLELFTGIVRDITDRKQTAEASQREHELSESIINTAQTIILVLDPDGRIIRFNPFLEELSGYSLEEVRGKSWFKTFIPVGDQNRICHLFKKFTNNTSVEGNVNPIVTKSGQHREVRWWSTTLKDGEDQVVAILSIGQDVTELMHTQDRLVQSERLSAIGEAMTGLIHESRNALARSQANLRRLTRRLTDQPDLLALIDAAFAAQEDLGQLFEDVRQYAAPVQLQCQLTDLGKLIDEVWEQLEPCREGRDVRLRQPDTSLNLECEIDPFCMRNVIRNILENALAACEDPVEIDIGCSEIQTEGRHFLRILVQDNGPGLTVDQAERVFDSFYTTKTYGTGLGLAIVKRLIEQHGGEVTVSSANQRGAKFVFTIPRSQK